MVKKEVEAIGWFSGHGGVIRDGAIGGAVGMGVVAGGAVLLGGGAAAIGVLGAMGFVGGGVAGGIAGEEIRDYFRVSGLNPPPIIIRRLKDQKDKKGESHAVIELSNFKIVSDAVIKSFIKSYVFGTEIDEEQYSFEGKPSYNIKIILKRPGITLAELDYSNWDTSKDFDVIITREEDGKLVPADDAERLQVLESLENMPKLLGDKLYHPGDVIEDKLVEKHQVVKPGGWVDTALNWFNWRVRGIVTGLKVYPKDGPSKKIETDQFLDELAEVAVQTGKYREILGHYESVLTDSHTRSLALLKADKQERLRRILFKPGILTGVVFGMTTLICISLIIASPFFFGAAAALGVWIAAISVGAIAAVITTISVWYAIKKIRLIAQIRKIGRDKSRIDNELVEKFSGFDVTKDLIEDLTSSKKDTLNLEGKKIGDSCVRIISKWMVSPSAENCTKIKLANNGITSVGAAKIAMALKQSSVRELDLRGNHLIRKNGWKALGIALSENLTVINFRYDKKWVPADIGFEIEKQLLINKYLSNPKRFSDISAAKKYLGGMDGLRSAADEKVKKYTDKFMAIIKSGHVVNMRSIGGLPDLARSRLLETYFAELEKQAGVTHERPAEMEQARKDRVFLVSAMLSSRAFLDAKNLEFSPDQILAWAFDYENVCDCGDLVSSLDRVRSFEILEGNEEEALAVDEVLQRFLQAKLDAQTDVEVFKKMVSESFWLRHYEFPKRMDEELRKHVKDAIIRNVTCEEIYLRSFYWKKDATREFVQANKESALDLLISFCKIDEAFVDKYHDYLLYRNKFEKGLDDDAVEDEVAKNFRALVRPVMFKLSEMLEGDRINLLEACFTDVEDQQYRAAFISGIIGLKTAPKEIEEILRDAFGEYKEEGIAGPYISYSSTVDYTRLLRLLTDKRVEAIEAGNKNLGKSLDEAMQAGIDSVFKYEEQEYGEDFAKANRDKINALIELRLANVAAKGLWFKGIRSYTPEQAAAREKLAKADSDLQRLEEESGLSEFGETSSLKTGETHDIFHESGIGVSDGKPPEIVPETDSTGDTKAREVRSEPDRVSPAPDAKSRPRARSR